MRSQTQMGEAPLRRLNLLLPVDRFGSSVAARGVPQLAIGPERVEPVLLAEVLFDGFGTYSDVALATRPGPGHPVGKRLAATRAIWSNVWITDVTHGSSRS